MLLAGLRSTASHMRRAASSTTPAFADRTFARLAPHPHWPLRYAVSKRRPLPNPAALRTANDVHCAQWRNCCGSASWYRLLRSERRQYVRWEFTQRAAYDLAYFLSSAAISFKFERLSAGDASARRHLSEVKSWTTVSVLKKALLCRASMTLSRASTRTSSGESGCNTG